MFLHETYEEKIQNEFTALKTTRLIKIDEIWHFRSSTVIHATLYRMREKLHKWEEQMQKNNFIIVINKSKIWNKNTENEEKKNEKVATTITSVERNGCFSFDVDVEHSAVRIPHLFALSMQRPITCNHYYYYYSFIIDVIIIVFVRFVFVVVSAFGIDADWSCKHRDIDLLGRLPFWFNGNQFNWVIQAKTRWQDARKSETQNRMNPKCHTCIFESSIVSCFKP